MHIPSSVNLQYHCLEKLSIWRNLRRLFDCLKFPEVKEAAGGSAGTIGNTEEIMRPVEDLWGTEWHKRECESLEGRNGMPRGTCRLVMRVSCWEPRDQLTCMLTLTRLEANCTCEGVPRLPTTNVEARSSAKGESEWRESVELFKWDRFVTCGWRECRGYGCGR